MANAPKLRNGLTTQQNNFKNVILNQLVETGKMNGTQAALQTYGTKDSKTAQNIGSENLSNPIIQKSIEETAKGIGITPSILMSKFSDISSKQVDKWSGDTVLKATIEMARILNLYPSSKHSNLNINLKGNIKDLNFKEAKERLKVIDSKLAQVMEEDKPITEETI